MNVTSPGAHIDQLVRQTRAHHVELSAMADQKANMMLTVASVVITLSLRYLTDPLLHWPALTMMAFCLLTVLLAAYTAMPGLSTFQRNVPAPDPHDSNVNLLFFGDFMHLDYESFKQAMEETFSDPGRTYETQLREVYLLGVYLARKKYRYVRLAYLSFLAGLLVSALVLAITLLIGV